ncbi:MAG: tyrosine-protein kinase family protein [Planctomycetaceae bacterium]
MPSRKAIYEAVWKEAKPHSSTSGKQWILDRHLSKDAWFGSPFELPWPLNDKTPPIISFFSFKGGVGRTTALAAFATNLARAGKRVLVVDFDLEAPGVGTLFGPTRGDGTSFGVVDFLLEWPVAPNGTINIADYCNVCDEPGIVGNGPEIICVPAGKVDERFIEKLARINYEYLYRSASEPGAPVADKSPIHQLLKLLRNRWKPDFVLIDSRAGLHDLGGLSLSGIAHWHVLFGLNSDQSWQGLSLAVSHLGKQEVLAGNPQRDCTLVQAMTPFPQAGREQAVATFKSQAYEVFSNLYYDDAQSPNAVWPVPDSEDPDQPHSPQVLSWDTRVFGYGPLTDIAGILCEGEYRTLTNAILDKLGSPTL